MTSRISLNTSPETESQLADLKNMTGMCKTYNIRRAIAVYHFLVKQRGSARVLIEEEGKPPMEVHFL